MWYKDVDYSMCLQGRYVRCQAYASGPMSIPEVSHDNCPQKIEKCYVLMARSMYVLMSFRNAGKEMEMPG